MKQCLFPAICLLISALLVGIMPTEADAAIYLDTVRLHILPPSDSAEDQALKIELRDKLLSKYSEALGESASAKEAQKEILRILPDIERDINSWIAEAGFSYTATTSLSCEWYETRRYGAFTLPSGEYTSLKITVGEGVGQNWWCVMYPPLCLECATEDAMPLTEEEIFLISGTGYNVKFKILELSSSIFRKSR